ncbi:SIR2 family protein [Flavobacterium silvaticum]|uniref:SIR2-like domain-containing protein n=1 Tax=Flavobacterium silvaticum TaxID=1852020 RepID=A0A972JI81_9FLAO|nr:SIR2 family protein [Flavobacterium silvaticum]NMH27913.1 hypothetical protein [Flavobacterium silvaticum]
MVEKDDIATMENFKFKNFVNFNKNEVSYREIETFVLSLLELKLKKDRKKFTKYVKEEILFNDGKKFYFEFDGVAADGIDDLEGPTIVEFKRSFSESLFDFIQESYKFYPAYRSVLLITSSTLTSEEKKYFVELSKKLPQNFAIKIWDSKEIINLSTEFLDESTKLINNLGKEVLKSTVEIASKSINWKQERDGLINNLNQSFKNDEIVFFLGSGVSKDAGLPAWDELLRSLNISIIESKVPFKLNSSQKEEIIKVLTKLQEGTPLVTASYIRKALDEGFLDEIRKALYATVKPLSEQRQLSTIATASRPLIGKLGVKALITYNFDDLLEQHLEKQNIDYKSIYREGDFEIPTKRPIYHVHGFVPSKKEKYSELDRAILVFAEDGYHTLQNDPYSWSNLVQLKALRESTCVLIGLSGIDPNLRRLFSNFSKRYDGCKHYILLQRQLIDTSTSLSTDEFEQFSTLHHKLQEGVFRELGLKVIWYEGHDDIPALIKNITEL